MNYQPIHYAVLRELDQWDENVEFAGLERQSDGTLTLARIPGAADGQPITYPAPFGSEPSGFAVGECRNLFTADTANYRVIGIDGTCNARMVLPGAGGVGNDPSQFKSPCGLLVVNDSLYVADSGNGRVQVFRLPTLELRAIWEEPLEEPVMLAADSKSRIYVLDRKQNRILRFNTWGVPDDVYNQVISTLLNGLNPTSLAIDGQDTLYVAVAESNEIVRVDAANKRLVSIRENKLQCPGIIAARGERLYIADSASGEIWVFDCKAGIFLGALKDYRGPVTAMAVDQSGTLYIKPGADDQFHQLPAGVAYMASGYLTAGPLDAGADTVWERIHAELDLPEGTLADLHLFTADSSSTEPIVWDKETRAKALDSLVGPVTTPRRYLWLQVILHSDDLNRNSPRLKQVQAETTAESYLSYLPAVYRREDAPKSFLEHWLALFRSELGDREQMLEEMPRWFDPLAAPEDQLRWLASWLAFDPPAGMQGNDLRASLQRVPELYNRRGTPSGICDLVELYTGVRPLIFEAFRERHVWQLGYTSTLGFDTALAAGLPDGMIVPGETWADPKYMGLRGDYYSGIDFQTFLLSRTDPNVDFDWKETTPGSLGEQTVPDDYFSVRWTGQVLPHYSERYTFHVQSDDGVRLWVDGIRIIDQWIDQPPTEHSSTVALELEAGRWYSIQLEYYEKTGGATIKLYWSSRSQIKDVIPQTQLYSVRDEGARPKAAQPQASEDTMLVGQTVVGQSGPLAAAEFGVPLFNDSAHLFTVIVPAAQALTLAQRQAIRRIIEAEKPAHTDFHLCFVAAKMQVGFQARLGIDSIVAGPPDPMLLSETTLGLDSYLAPETEYAQLSRVGKRAHLGHDTILG